MQTSGLSIDALGLESRTEWVEDQADQSALRITGVSYVVSLLLFSVTSLPGFATLARQSNMV